MAPLLGFRWGRSQGRLNSEERSSRASGVPDLPSRRVEDLLSSTHRGRRGYSRRRASLVALGGPPPRSRPWTVGTGKQVASPFFCLWPNTLCSGDGAQRGPATQPCPQATWVSPRPNLPVGGEARARQVTPGTLRTGRAVQAPGVWRLPEGTGGAEQDRSSSHRPGSLSGSAERPHPHRSEPWGRMLGNGGGADARAGESGAGGLPSFPPLLPLLQCSHTPPRPPAGCRKSKPRAFGSSSLLQPHPTARCPWEGLPPPQKEAAETWTTSHPRTTGLPWTPALEGTLPSNPEQEERYVPRVTDTAGQVTTTLRASVSPSVSWG